MNKRIENECSGALKKGGLTRRDFLKVIPFITGGALLAACGKSEQSIITDAGESKPGQDFGVTIETAPGRTGVELFTSEKHFLNEKQEEIAGDIGVFINSGEHNVTEVQTSYTEGYLTAGRASYSPDTQGRGNNLRVTFIQSSQHFLYEKDGDVKKVLTATLEDAQNVHKVNTIFQEGYLVAAEVWYYQP